jgi:hypothetical protein
MLQHDINTLLMRLQEEGRFDSLANNPNLQFTADSQELLFSSLLPERLVQANTFTEDGIRFKTLMANDSTRYSPPVKRGNAILSSTTVSLADSDIAAELTMQAYESFIRTFQASPMQAVANLLRFFETGVAMPLAVLREKYRADIFDKGYVERRGANNFYELVKFPEPAGHRITVLDWSDPEADILGVLKSAKRMLRDKGYNVTRMITNSDVIDDYFLKNDAIKQYGVMMVNASPIQGTTAFTLPAMDEYQVVFKALGAAQLPVPQIYDHGYDTETGTGYQKFLNSKIILVCNTGRESEPVNLGDDTNLVLPNTLGYTAIGLTTGQLQPGVRTKVTSYDGKDARIEAYGWQTTFPVLQDPEAYVVIDVQG